MQFAKQFSHIFVWFICFSLLNISTAAHSVELPAEYHTSLGAGYRSQHNELLGTHCVTGKTGSVITGNSQVSYDQNASFEVLAKHLSGAMSAGIDIPLIGGAEGAASLASEHASSGNSITWNYIFKAQTHSDFILDEELKVSSIANERIFGKEGKDSELVYQECGDQFVSRIDYGASLIATLKIEFLTQKDKLDLGGKIKADFDAKLVRVKGDGELKYINEGYSERVSVRLIASQVGGDHASLAKILDEEIVSCKLSNLDICSKALRKVLEYGNGDFMKQTASRDKFAVLRYHTEPYKKYGTVKHLGETSESELISADVEIKRRELIIEGNRYKQLAVRALSLIDKWSDLLNAKGLLFKIIDIKDKLVSLLADITKQTKLCFKYPQKCLEQKFNREFIDPSILDLQDVPFDPMQALWIAARDDDDSAIYTAIKGRGASDLTPIINGSLPIHIASELGRANAVRALLVHGSSKEVVNQKDSQGMNSLCRAVQNGHRGVVKALVTSGKANIEDSCAFETSPGDKDDITPLQLAAFLDNGDMVDLLMNLGASINAQSAQNKSTALHFAALRGHHSMAIKLLEKNANFLLSNIDGNIAIELAVEFSHREVVRLLKEAFIRLLKEEISNSKELGEHLKLRKQFGFKSFEELELLFPAILLEAVEKGDADGVKVLLQEGASPNRAVDNLGRTVLHYVALKGLPPDWIRLFMTYQADIDMVDANGDTALLLATANGRVEQVSTLLEYLPNVNLRRQNGLTALQVAQKRNYIEIAGVLCRYLSAPEIDEL